LLLRAYELAALAHAGQLRDSGEEYVSHPLHVGKIITDLQLDDTSIAAGFLHDVVEDTPYSLDYLAKEFGEEIARLVDGVTKLSRLEYRSRQERQAENLRKMFLAMASDIRIILIKLADRLHNMQTLRFHSSLKRQKEIAEETKTIYAPLAHRLGIFRIKSQLEDLALESLEPDKYEALVKQMTMERQEREHYLELMCDIIMDNLRKAGISAEISSRSKNYYSIYAKMLRQQKNLSEIFDLNAVRVIVDTVVDCYGVLGVVHTLWKPIPGRFKDFVAMPKNNMYQSIHTTVIGENGVPLEVQIRTHDMHRIAEYGIAAHWRYKEGRSADADFEKKIEWLRQMLEWQQDLDSPKEFVETVKSDLFSDSVFVFSPKGDVYELSAGSCPIDFAYRVHTQVGHQCVGSKVNKRIVPLDYRLENGDIVEILTNKNSHPSRDWLKIVKTQTAKNRINQWFNREAREVKLAQGRELLEKECQKYQHDPDAILKPDKLTEAANRLGFSHTDDLYVAVGSGSVTVYQAISKIKADYRQGIAQKPKIREFDERKSRGQGVWVADIDNVAVSFARCCKPLPGDSIVGYITRGRGVSIHRDDCNNIANYRKQEQDRLIEAGWFEQIHGVFQVELKILANNRDRLTIDIMATIADSKIIVNALHITFDPKTRIATVLVKLEVNSLDQLNHLLARLMRVPDVLEAGRVTSPEGRKNN
jgi:GTP pyrophosphokinase